jgi:hypothetical protein
MAGLMARSAGTTTARGYGSRHQAERARWQPVIDRGEGWCAEIICVKASRRIAPGEPWDLAHAPDRSGYLGPAHQECNRAEAGRRGNRKRWSPPRRWATSRRW